MVIVDGTEYATKEEVTAKCREYAASHPGTTFFNYAHNKNVRRDTTEEERSAARESGRPVYLSVDVYEWEKLYTDSAVLNSHPELKGMWRQI